MFISYLLSQSINIARTGLWEGYSSLFLPKPLECVSLARKGKITLECAITDTVALIISKDCLSLHSWGSFSGVMSLVHAVHTNTLSVSIIAPRLSWYRGLILPTIRIRL